MPPIYRDFDQAGLDAAYNNRAAVPDHGRFLERWAAASLAVRERADARLDLPYGPGPRQRLDLFPVPGAREPAACLLFFHGGYWQTLDKNSFAWLAPGLAACGIGLAVAGYDLCPQVSLGDIAIQSRMAFAWLQANAAAHGIDPARIVVAGHSAGGHLAALLAHADWTAGNEKVRPPAGAIALSGIFDLEPIRLSYLNATLGLEPSDVLALSPLHTLRRGGVPLVLAVGGRETLEFRRQQHTYAVALSAAGAAPVAAIETPEDHHFSILDRLTEPGQSLRAALLRLTMA